ncbi:hypothetical protein MPF_1418 [Methanohalophilus portucalensis FDF-1]|uniref:Uncharacterized protein n=1 Tax=Methanohalophilus portucalensis FDF-1 TaxID=523843 RepID=A0A1L9C3D4_9EURY|nr:hypothetical protein MPF_1418 [Methanohalophilus portucalensis FDF-1]
MMQASSCKICTQCREKLKVMKMKSNVLYYCRKCGRTTSRELLQ